MKKQEYIIQIAPVTPLPVFKTQVYSYLSEDPLPKGTLVLVPFYRRQIEGIVISSSPYFSHVGSFKLKKIVKVIEQSFLTNKQIDLANFISQYYMAPLGVVLKSIIPKRVGFRLAKGADNGEEPERSEGRKKTKIFDSRTVAIFGPKEKRKGYLISLIKEIVQSKKQCLILVPEIFHAFDLAGQIGKIFSENEISLIHSKIAKGKIYNDWKKIKSNEIKIVISTKIGVLFPYCKLGAIFVLEPQDVSHKQSEAMPRFNAVRAAEFLAESHQARMIYSGSVLSIKNYFASKSGKCETVDFRKKAVGPKVEIVNMALEKKKSDFPISEQLYKFLARAVKSKKQSLLIVNRKGLSTFSKCQSCGQILKCPKCKKALVYFGEHSEYRCLHCSHKIDLLSSCPSCGGFQFSHHGIGIQLVESKLKKLFPSAIVSRLDSDVMKSSKKYELVKNDFESGKISVLVGTQIAAREIFGKNLDLVGIVAAHDFLNLPDFGSREKALSTLFQAKDLLKRSGTFVVQTFLPNDPVIRYIDGENQKNFFESEARFRKKMGYPPFAKLIKLVYRGSSKKVAVDEAKKLFDCLDSESDNGIDISEPYEALSSGNRGLFAANILLKISPDKDLSGLAIFPIIRGIKKGWAVDVDPVSTI
jgi:primosomal protein N' (replication factor Y) (superfamily II helicase)